MLYRIPRFSAYSGGRRWAVFFAIGAYFLVVPLPAGSSTAEMSPVPPTLEEGIRQLAEQPLAIEERFVRAGFRQSRRRRIDTVILHSCFHPGPGDRYAPDRIRSLLIREGVSAHYLIDREGKVYRLVAEENVAYHAGVSRLPDGRSNVNEVSLGIELVNAYDDQYTEAQYRSLEALLRDLRRRYPLRYLYGHGQIAPLRRSDPWNFEWSRLSAFRNGRGEIIDAFASES